MGTLRFNFRPLAGALLVAWSFPSFALHLGTPQAISYIGENLLLEIPILGSTPEELKDVTVKSVSYPYAPAFAGHPEYKVTLKFNNDLATLIVTSDTIVNDSILDLAMSVNYAAGNIIQPVTVVLDTKPPSIIATTKMLPEVANNISTQPVEVKPILEERILTRAVPELGTVPLKPAIPSSVSVAIPAMSGTNISVSVIDDKPVHKSGTYTVQPKDTLYSIASNTKPELHTVAEWMSLIYSANPSLRTTELSNLNTLELPNPSEKPVNKVIQNKHLKSSFLSTSKGRRTTLVNALTNDELNAESKASDLSQNKVVQSNDTITTNAIKSSPRQLTTSTNAISKNNSDGQVVLQEIKSSNLDEQTKLKTKQLLDTNKNIQSLELQVKELMLRTKKLDAQISKYQKKVSSDKKKSAPKYKKSVDLGMRIPLLEGNTKGLLSVIDAYTVLKSRV